ncbi:MAG TPA: hypothetical protein VFE05_22815 [Longimicrobiaceae bacterium]|jgi:hypothetical protein|nr:hypothetical protein [Longimicrobiaceae bacterium]
MYGVLVPIIAVSIPLVAVIGRTIVGPVLAAMERRDGSAPRIQALEQRIAMLEQNLSGMEQTVERLTEESDFHRRLAAPLSPSARA